jgi:hypothetical protein
MRGDAQPSADPVGPTDEQARRCSPELVREASRCNARHCGSTRPLMSQGCCQTALKRKLKAAAAGRVGAATAGKSLQFVSIFPRHGERSVAAPRTRPAARVPVAGGPPTAATTPPDGRFRPPPDRRSAVPGGTTADASSFTKIRGGLSANLRKSRASLPTGPSSLAAMVAIGTRRRAARQGTCR